MKKLVTTIVVGGFAALLFGVSSSPRAQPGKRSIGGTTLNCSDVCLRKCQWEKGLMGLDTKIPEVDRRHYKESRECITSAACQDVDGYYVTFDTDIGKDQPTANRYMAICQRCRATGPKGKGNGDWVDDCPESVFGGAGNGGAVGGRTYGGSTYGGPLQGPDKTPELARCFEQIVRDKIKEGHYVKNYNLLRTIKTGLVNFNIFLDDSKGGRCGEYGEWGTKWIEPCVTQLIGPGAIIDHAEIVEKSWTEDRRAGWGAYNPDLMFTANHRATRVVLPDGRRFIVDFWEGVGSGQPRMVPEKEWSDRWKKRIGDQLIGIDSGVQLLKEEQKALKQLMGYDEEKSFNIYRMAMKKDGKGAEAEIWIKSWKLDPW